MEAETGFSVLARSPVHSLKTYPSEGVAVNVIEVPSSNLPPSGETLPHSSGVMVTERINISGSSSSEQVRTRNKTGSMRRILFKILMAMSF